MQYRPPDSGWTAPRSPMRSLLPLCRRPGIAPLLSAASTPSGTPVCPRRFSSLVRWSFRLLPIHVRPLTRSPGGITGLERPGDIREGPIQASPGGIIGLWLQSRSRMLRPMPAGRVASFLQKPSGSGLHAARALMQQTLKVLLGHWIQQRTIGRLHSRCHGKPMPIPGREVFPVGIPHRTVMQGLRRWPAIHPTGSGCTT